MPPHTDVAVAEPSSSSWADSIEAGLKQARPYYAGQVTWQSPGWISAVSRNHPAHLCLVMAIGDLLDLGTNFVMDSLLPPVFEQVVQGLCKGQVSGEAIDVL